MLAKVAVVVVVVMMVVVVEVVACRVACGQAVLPHGQAWEE